MAEEKTEAPVEESKPARPKGPLLQLILVVVNTLVILGAVGMLYYVKIIFKRPPITEEFERKRLEKVKADPLDGPLVPGQITFGPMTINLQPDPARVGRTEGQIHTAWVSVSFDLRDIGQKDVVESIRPVIMDKLLAMLAQKTVQELTTVQGRYVLRTQILDLVNVLTSHLPSLPFAEPPKKQLLSSAPKDEHGAAHEGAPPAEGGGEHGEANTTPKFKEEKHADGPPIGTIFRDGLVSNVFFNQFIVH
ncbi:flagellar basal body-associated FliL family protein [Bdellovibrionota bacterium FG-1]